MREVFAVRKSHLTAAFRKTAREFPAQTEALNATFDVRLSQLRIENADAAPEKQRHLESQILPGIAAYETLQTVMPKEQALQTVHGYVERRAQKSKRSSLKGQIVLECPAVRIC